MYTVIMSGIFMILSFFFAAIGIGGGVMYVPLLVTLGYAIHQAAPLSLALISAGMWSAVLVYSRKNVVDWKLALLIDPPTDIMAFVGGYYARSLPATALTWVLVGIMLVSALLLFFQPRLVRHHPDKQRWYHWVRTFHDTTYVVNPFIVLPITGAVGLMCGMLGITGGVVKLPLMVLLCGVPMHVAVATSAVMVAVTAVCGLGGHILSGYTDFSVIVPFMVAGFIGGQIGSRASLSIDKKLLKKVCAVALFGIAVRMALQLIS